MPVGSSQSNASARRSFKINMLTFLYKMYVRPHLEYCAPIWCPYFAKDIDILEKMQWRATKLLSDISHLSFYSLYCRRQRGDLIEAFKILNGYYDIDLAKFFTLNSTDVTRGHSMTLLKFLSRLVARHNFFTNRVVNAWNSLPNDV